MSVTKKCNASGEVTAEVFCRLFFFFATFVTGLKTSTVADICPVSQSTSLQPNLLMTESVSGLVQAVDAIKVHTLILDQRQED